MALDGCSSCVKYLMFAFNFLFWILGCVILGIGIWVKVDPGSLKQLAHGDEALDKFLEEVDNGGYETVAAYVLIVVGSAMMLIGFLGCCGAIKESQCMLATFFVFLSIIFVSLLAAGVYVIVVKEKVKDGFAVSLMKVIDKVKAGNADAKSLMKTIQDKFHCCGAGNGSKDYGSYSENQCNSTNFNTPCATSLYNVFTKNIVIVGGVTIGIAVVMLMGMIFSMLLCCAIRENANMAY